MELRSGKILKYNNTRSKINNDISILTNYVNKYIQNKEEKINNWSDIDITSAIIEGGELFNLLENPELILMFVIELQKNKESFV